MKFEVRNASYHYPKTPVVLENISFLLDKPGVMAVLGANGSGKTTLIKCMLGLLKWTGGASFIDGQDIAHMPTREIWRTVAYVPQARTNAFACTVLDTVLLGRNVYTGLFTQPTKADVEIARQCLAEIGIAHLADKRADELSGGEMQMVLIARALAAKPALLVMDEPESNLDFKNQSIVLQTITRLTREKHITAIVNTHYPDHAIAIADKALILYPDGESVFGNAREIICETTLSRAFDIGVRLCPIVTDDGVFTSVVPRSSFATPGKDESHG